MRAIVKEKKERSLGTKLFLKADRSYTPKSAIARRPYKPGPHGPNNRARLSDFARQLQEKQKIQVTFGLTNKQMQALFSGTGLEAMTALHLRLDTVAFLLGLARSMRVARQLVSHGHITVNGRKVTISSSSVKVKDTIAIRPESRESKMFEGLANRLKAHKPPVWLRLDADKLQGSVAALPKPEELQFPFDVALVGQYYSR